MNSYYKSFLMPENPQNPEVITELPKDKPAQPINQDTKPAKLFSFIDAGIDIKKLLKGNN